MPVILTPFMIIFLNLLISVYPRFPRAGRQRFPIWRNADPEDFDFIADTEGEIEGLPARCATSVAYPLVEEHHAADGRCSVDGLPCGGSDPARSSDTSEDNIFAAASAHTTSSRKAAPAKRVETPQFIVGMLNFAPSLTPDGQRAVTVLVLV